MPYQIRRRNGDLPPRTLGVHNAAGEKVPLECVKIPGYSRPGRLVRNGDHAVPTTMPTSPRKEHSEFSMENTYRNIAFAPSWFLGGFRKSHLARCSMMR